MRCDWWPTQPNSLIIKLTLKPDIFCLLFQFHISLKILVFYLLFWATVCKTVRPMLSDRCPVCPVLSCLSCLSVTFVHCGQTVGRIKIKLGMQVGIDHGHIVLGGDPAPPSLKGTAPNFRPISVAAKWLHGSRCHFVWR